MTKGIGDTLADLFARADAEAVPTNEIAEKIAKDRIEANLNSWKLADQFTMG